MSLRETLGQSKPALLTKPFVKAFNKFCSALDGVRFTYTEDRDIPHNFTVVSSRSKTDLLVTLTDEFSYQDIPFLIKAIEIEYNSLAQKDGRGEEFLLRCKDEIAALYAVCSQEIGDFIKEIEEDQMHDIPNGEEVLMILAEVKKDIEATSFSLSEYPNPASLSNWHSYEMAQHRDKWRAIFNKRSKNHQPVSTEGILSMTSKALKNALELSLEKILLEKGMKETLFRSKIIQIFTEHYGKPESLQGITKMQRKNFPDLCRSLYEAQKTLEKAKEAPTYDAINLAEMQKVIAQILNNILYSEKIFPYHDETYSLTDFLKKERGNCMLRGQILYMIWKHFFGEELLGAYSDTHFFSVLRLANDQFLSLDDDTKVLDLSHTTAMQYLDEDKKDWVILGEHRALYLAATYSWKTNTRCSEQTIDAYYQRAFRICPNDPDNLSHYAKHLVNHKRYSEAGNALRKAIILRGNDPFFRKQYAEILMMSNHFHEAKVELQKAHEIDPKEPYYKKKLADCHKITGDFIEAQKVYDEAQCLGYSNTADIFSAKAELHDPLYIERLQISPEQKAHLLQNITLGKALNLYKSALELHIKDPEKNPIDAAFVQERIAHIEHDISTNSGINRIYQLFKRSLKSQVDEEISLVA